MALQAFYPVDEEAAAICEAWKGIIANVPSQQETDQIQADPYGCTGLWEMYQVQWQADPQVHVPPLLYHKHNQPILIPIVFTLDSALYM